MCNALTVLYLVITIALYSCEPAPSNQNKTSSITCSNGTGPAINSTVDSLSSVENLPTSIDTSATRTDWLLVPGMAAGKTLINEEANAVLHRFGKPDEQDAAMMKAVYIWFQHHNNKQHALSIYTSHGTDSGEVARVKQIRVSSPAFKTAEGIRVTASLQTIEKVFKQLSKVETYTCKGKTYTVNKNSTGGIAFEMDANNFCVAIVIQAAGNQQYGSYLKLRGSDRK